MDKISNLLCNYKCLRNEYTEYKAEYKQKGIDNGSNL